MSTESDFLLGIAYSLLTQCRLHFINTTDEIGLTLIENEYQALVKNIEKIYYHTKLGKPQDAN